MSGAFLHANKVCQNRYDNMNLHGITICHKHNIIIQLKGCVLHLIGELFLR